MAMASFKKNTTLEHRLNLEVVDRGAANMKGKVIEHDIIWVIHKYELG